MIALDNVNERPIMFLRFIKILHLSVQSNAFGLSQPPFLKNQLLNHKIKQ